MEKLLGTCKKRIQKMSLVSKITITVTIIIIIPIAIICNFYFRSFQKSLLKNADNQMQDALRNIETNMDANVDTIQAVINELNYRQEFSYFLDDRNILSQKELTYYLSSIQAELINIRYLYPNTFYYIAIFSANSQIQEKYERQYSIDELKEKPYYNEIIKTTNTVCYGMVRNSEFKNSNINVNELNLDKSDIKILPVYLKIYNLSTKRLIGVIEVDIEITKLMEVENLKITKGSDYLLFDQNNQLVYQTGKYDKDDFKNIDFKKNEGTTDITIKNETYMFAYSHSIQTGLVRAVITSKHNVLSYTNDIMIKVIIVALISIIFMVILIHLIIKKMLKRLVILDDMMEKIELGQFDVSIQDDGNEDEISRISKSFNRMVSRLDSVIHSVIEKEKAQKEAELRALQAQINPHFLYNTLENMRMQCEIDEYYTIGDNLAVLGDMFRYSIKWGCNEVPFDLEWTNLKNYISIMKMRFDEEMECVMEYEETLGDIIVPKLMLQPLVENSFNHGFRGVIPPWFISIKAYRRMDQLIIEIQDNGCGIDEERLERIRYCMKENISIEDVDKKKNSIGIVNVKQRLEMICKGESNIEITSQVGIGTKIVITIILEGKNV